MSLFLLFASAWLNYIDRGTLGVAAPVLAPELHFRPSQMGWLLSAFFWTYACCQPLAGWLVQRYDVVKVYGLAFFLWSVATLLTGFAGGFAALFLLRMLLGAGESAAFPSYARILTTAVPEHRRGLAFAMVDIGTKGGAALGTYLGGQLVAAYGWRSMFLVLGGISLLWLPPWFLFAPKAKGFAGSAEPAPSMPRILREHRAWATFLGLFCFNYSYYFLLTWLPSYLVAERHFSLRMMSVFAALPFAVTAVASLAMGWWSDRWIRAGRAAPRVRQAVLLSGLLLCGLTLTSATVAGNRLAMTALMVAFLGLGVATSNVWAFTQTLAGPSAASQWTGLQNGFGNLGGVVAPVVTGMIVQQTGSFFLAFAAASVMLFLSALCYGGWLWRVEPVEW